MSRAGPSPATVSRSSRTRPKGDCDAVGFESVTRRGPRCATSIPSYVGEAAAPVATSSVDVRMTWVSEVGPAKCHVDAGGDRGAGHERLAWGEQGVGGLVSLAGRLPVGVDRGRPPHGTRRGRQGDELAVVDDVEAAGREHRERQRCARRVLQSHLCSSWATLAAVIGRLERIVVGGVGVRPRHRPARCRGQRQHRRRDQSSHAPHLVPQGGSSPARADARPVPFACVLVQQRVGARGVVVRCRPWPVPASCSAPAGCCRTCWWRC